ncbi:MAG: hypothetical protein E7611_00700 [Ruminococcaceae bacterium]|nr:hypothetical protein [Oscillospiraceae bacterium]
MSWYNTSGPCPNYVLFSKVRYVRNPAKRNFPHLIDQKRSQELSLKLESILTSNGFRGENTVTGINPAILSLAERQLVERDFVYSERSRALYLNDPCNIVISVGGSDLISISSVVAGLSVIEAKNMASRAEETVDREIPFAYNERVGYLSYSCADCGSGLTLSAAMFLPSLRLIGGKEDLDGRLQALGMQLMPMFTYEDGDLYIISYKPHFLADEDSAAVHFSDTVSAIAEKERNALGMFFSGKGKIIYAAARRALGSLLYAESMSEHEMLSHVSSIRLCHCLSEEAQSSSLPSVSELNFLCAEGLSASVIATSNEACTSNEECERMRSTLISRYIERKKEVI